MGLSTSGKAAEPQYALFVATDAHRLEIGEMAGDLTQPLELPVPDNQSFIWSGTSAANPAVASYRA